MIEGPSASRRAIREAIPLIGFALILGIVVSLGAKSSVKSPPPRGRIYLETALKLTNTLWIDARADEKFAAGHIPGALPLNAENYDANLGAVLDAWNPDRPVVVYCDWQKCGASQTIADKLAHEGISKIYVLQEGWAGWIERQNTEGSVPPR